jgi:Sulfotransferase family
MVMQILAAGGFPVLTDEVRQPDEDNPRGYFEYEPVKRIRERADWFSEAQGKAVKIVAPLLAELPPGLACRIVFIERDLNKTVASQTRMLARRLAAIENTPRRQEHLKEEYAALVQRVKAFLAKRPRTRVLYLEYECVLSDPPAAARAINGFLEAELDTAAMAAQVERRIS